MLLLCLLATLGAASLCGADTGRNMNLGGYKIANGDPNAATPYNTDFGTKGAKYFDVYAGPISTRYGEVFWKGLPAVPLPPDVVARYDNATIAIIGYEQDQVIRGENGSADLPVLIYWAYNHQ